MSATATPTASVSRDAKVRLRCRVTLADGRRFTGELPPERHRAIQLGMLHRDTADLVELTPGTRPPDGRLEVDRRHRPEHYLPGGASGNPDWLAELLEHAQRIVAGDFARHRFDAGPREEAFVGAAPRTEPRGSKRTVEQTRFLWVDIDKPGELPALWALLAERPCHLLIETAGSGGMHAYWRLDWPLAASRVDRRTGETDEPIERANLRLIHHLGTDPDGKPNVADAACKERARVMRLAGTINHKTGRYARIVHADFELPGYPIGELVGDLPDPTPPAATHRSGRSVDNDDPYKTIPPPVYFEALAGIVVPGDGLVRCPAPGHEDQHPSCSVGPDPSTGWCCHSGSCGARGAIYDLASVVLGGPWGPELRAGAFKRARAYVVEALGEAVGR
jgi:hypothetical protein